MAEQALNMEILKEAAEMEYMIRCIRPSLLVVGVEPGSIWETSSDVYTASTMREVIATLRLIDIDLLVVGFDVPHLDVWNLIHSVLTAWPQQRWLLMSEHVTAEQEVLARSLGALMVLNSLPEGGWLGELAASLGRRVNCFTPSETFGFSR